MSGNRDNLPNTKADARAFVKYLADRGLIKKLYIHGSRSPLVEKQPREDSDWDFFYVPTVPNMKLMHPRKTRQLNACFAIFKEGNPTFVEIYPTDKYGILKND